MPIALSKVTSQGKISVPAEVRRKLGVRPGSVLEWEERNGEFIIKRAARYSSRDIHAALFPQGVSEPKGNADHKEGIRSHLRKRHARR